MPFITRAKACAHMLTLGWVIIWVVTVPLFHAHLPDVDDFAFRQGVAHTVFSSDLPGEFYWPNGNDSQLSTKTPHSPELGFVLSTAEESKKGKSQALSVVIICSWPFDRSSLIESAAQSRQTHCKSNLLAGPSSPRAPPFVVSS